MTDAVYPQARARSISVEQPAAYRLEVQGAIDAGWAAWFGGTSIEQRAGMITLDAIVDQAALRGLLCRLWDLNLSVIAVNRMEVDALATGGTPHDEQR